ncbi:tumor necrosis factor-like isoform X2 [Ruditapes philippinarum]|uniref:tumor necrosis factor-like isoform X2 n=1 Tax=Ruditapes philippinarum TaxID=129788 RepID=UPI00295C0E27|nr:tumor necrosis factor-like isoform X2 [Ruditapes philippinarum]
MYDFKYKRYTLKILLSFAVCEIVTLSVLVTYWREQKEISLAPTQQKKCYPQHKLFRGDDRNIACPGKRIFAKDKSKQNSYCCGDTSDVLNILLNKTVLERFDSDVNPESTSFDLTDFNCSSSKHQTPALTLTGAWHKKSSTHDKISWKSDQSTSAKAVFMYLEKENSVLVEETGFFYILSQLEISVDKNFNNIGHSVQLLSDNSTVSILLEDLFSPCQIASDASQEKTSVIGAVFQLNKGDRVYVTTSYPDNISFNLKNSFFSIYKL